MNENLSIQSLSDRDLLTRTEYWARKEREATSQLIEHLREVERRKLYCDLELNSIHKYCTKILKLSDGSAQRRIELLKLTEVLPEMKEKFESGEVSLSVAAQVQSYFRKEGSLTEMTLETKRGIAQEVLGKTCLEAERILLSHSVEPERHQPERVKPVSQTHCRIEFTASDEERAIFEKARGLLAHAQPCSSWNELFVALAKEVISKRDPARKTGRSASSKRQSQKPQRSDSPTPKEQESQHGVSSARSDESSQKRPPSAPLKREVLKQADSKCVNCGSEYGVQIDHKEDWSLGGATTLENLQALCRKCNHRKAINRFGLKKIEKEIKASRTEQTL